MTEDIVQDPRPLGFAFEFDPDRRITAATFRASRFELAPPRVEIPFAYMKEAVAQILQFEAEVTISELPAGTKPKDYPPGVRGKLRCAEIIILEARNELAAHAAVDDSESARDKERTEKATASKLGLLV